MEQSTLILLLIAFIAYCMMKKSEGFVTTPGGMYVGLIPPLEGELTILSKQCQGGKGPHFVCEKQKAKSMELNFVRALASGTNPFGPK